MAQQPVEVDVDKIQYYDNEGNPINSSGGSSGGTGGSGSGGGMGWLSGILGAVPGILSALFPGGVKGNNQQYPYVSTLPNGQQQVTLAGSNNNNLMMFALLGMVAYLVFTGKPAVQVKKR